MARGAKAWLKRNSARASLLLLNAALLVRYRRLTQRFLERMRHLPNLQPR
ncbi:hypothetical protein X731_12040 [Mesorhizobium sp. L2C054A000]|nr:hypothetical protein X731_12040 [Mesorhizobium sp. L2C054A000]